MLNVLILAAGQGTRMKSLKPKVLHTLGGRTMLDHVIQTAQTLKPEHICVIANDQLPPRNDVMWAIQKNPCGTGDAVRQALEQHNFQGDILILYGDAPLVQGSVLQIAYRQYQSSSKSMMVLGMYVEEDNRYGRLVINSQAQLEKIIEYKDANEYERTLPLCNSGVVIAPASALKDLVKKLEPKNQAGEFYLTDCIALARQQGIPSFVFEVPHEDFCGINTRAELAYAEMTLQDRWRTRWMAEGVSMIDPQSVFLCYDTELAPDVTIHPYVTLGPGVKIAANSTVLSFCHLEETTLAENVTVGPFAHLRGHTHLEQGAVIGNFVEAKKAHLGAKAKAKHLSYLGDVTIGDKTNIGAGTICANYDGFSKFQTHIGHDVSVGANASLVAPLTIGDGAMIAAGSVVTQDIEPHALAIARAPQQNKPGHAQTYRQKKSRRT